MKTQLKTTGKKKLAVLAATTLGFVTLTIGGIALVPSAQESAQASAAEDFYMRGISIRYAQEDGLDGIRFGALMKKSWYDGIVAGNEGKQITTGTVIVPAALLEETTYNAVMAAVASGDASNTDTTEILNNSKAVISLEGTDYYQTLVYMHSIPKENYNTELTAVAYVAVNGAPMYYTAEPCTRSLSETAKYFIDNKLDENPALQNYLLTYAVTYYDTDGSTVIKTENVMYGETPAYAAPEKELKNPEQIFEKWVTKAGGSAEANGAIKGSTSVYASAIDPETMYKVTFKNEDGTTLSEENVQVGKYPEYKGATPEKEGNEYTSYAFEGFGEMARVTKDAEYTAKYVKYKTMKNYYYCAGEEFTLPTQAGTELSERHTLSYSFNGSAIEAGQSVTINEPGEYEYVITADGVSVSATVKVMDKTEYYKNYFRTDTNQFVTNASSTDGRIIINGNNKLQLQNDGSLKYTNTRQSTWDGRIELNSAFAGGSSAKWDISVYHVLNFQIKIEEGTTLSNPTASITNNAYYNAGWLWPMIFADESGNEVKKENLQANVWYTAIVDLSKARSEEENDMKLYLFNDETGSVYIKNIQFDGVENPADFNNIAFVNGQKNGYMKPDSSTGIVDGVQVKYHYVKNDNKGTWDSRADFYVNNAIKNDASAITFNLYVNSDEAGTDGVGTGVYFPYGDAIFLDENYNRVAAGSVKHKQWYTVVSTVVNPTYFYTGDGKNIDAYISQITWLPKGKVTGEGSISVASNATLLTLGDGYTYKYFKTTARTDGNSVYDSRIILPAGKSVTFDVCVTAIGERTSGNLDCLFRDLNNGYASPSSIVAKKTGEAFTGATSGMQIGVWYTVTFSATEKAKNLHWGANTSIDALIANVAFI